MKASWEVGGQDRLGEGLAPHYNNGHSCDLFILNGTSDGRAYECAPRVRAILDARNMSIDLDLCNVVTET